MALFDLTPLFACALPSLADSLAAWLTLHTLHPAPATAAACLQVSPAFATCWAIWYLMPWGCPISSHRECPLTD